MTAALVELDALDAIAFDDISLRFTARPTPDLMHHVGAWLAKAERALAWWIGDYVNATEDFFGEEGAQFLDGAQEATWRQYAWVCRKVPVERRCAALSWSHHREVADLTADQQYVWLSRAEDAGYSCNRLRRELAKATRAESRLWVLVAATSPEDAEDLCARLTAEGRAAKVIER